MHIFDNLKQYDNRNRASKNVEIHISEEVKAHNAMVEKEERKQKLLNAIFVPLFFIVLLGIIIGFASSESLQYFFIGVAILIAIAFMFFTSYVLLTNSKHKKWKRIVIAAIIAIAIIGLLVLVGSVLPDSYVNDVHRPDKF